MGILSEKTKQIGNGTEQNEAVLQTRCWECTVFIVPTAEGTKQNEACVKNSMYFFG